jgi:hypothetical protein
MKTRKLLIGMLMAAVFVAVAGVTWAGDRNAAHYGPPRNAHHSGWHKQVPPRHPYRHVYRPYHYYRPYPWRGHVYHQYYAPYSTPYYAPLYGSHFSATIAQPNWAFSWSVGLP